MIKSAFSFTRYMFLMLGSNKEVIATLPAIKLTDGWVLISGDFRLPSGKTSYYTINRNNLIRDISR